MCAEDGVELGLYIVNGTPRARRLPADKLAQAIPYSGGTPRFTSRFPLPSWNKLLFGTTARRQITCMTLARAF